MEYFCDRQKELQLLLQCMANNCNITLVAQRRMGKTGLIYRLVDELKSSGSDYTPIYIDIFATRNMSELNKAIADAILATYPEETSSTSSDSLRERWAARLSAASEWYESW